MRRRQTLDPGKGGLGRGDVLQCQVVVDRAQVWGPRQPRPGEQCLDLGAEQEGLPVGQLRRRVIERFLAEAVARQDQPARAAVPQCQREHAAQPSEQRRPPGMPAIDDDLAVGAAAEDIAERRQLGAQCSEIVDFAVVGQPDIARHAGHRLMARRRQVDDRQPCMRQRAQPVGPHPFVVRAAVMYCGDHRPQPRLDFAVRQRRLRQDEPGNAAHASGAGPASASRLDHVVAGEPAAGAGVAGIDNERAMLDQQPVIDRIVVGADQRRVEPGGGGLGQRS